MSADLPFIEYGGRIMAIASGGVRVMNASMTHALDLSEDALADAATREQHELERREHD